MEEKNVSMKENITDKKSSKKNFNNQNYSVKKRAPRRPIEGYNVVFISKKAPFKAQLNQCCELLTNGEKEIILHGLGAAIQKCCNLALQLNVLFNGNLELEVNTGTVDLIDDLEPLIDDLEYDVQVRQTSSVHIRVSRKSMLGAN